MITIQRKRQLILLIAAALTAVLLFASGLPEMKLSPGAPFPGGAVSSSPAGKAFERSQSFSFETSWIQGVAALVFLGLSIYVGINLARKVPYKKLLRGVVAALAIWAVLSCLPALVDSSPLEAPVSEPGLAETSPLTYEIIELGNPPLSFVRSIAAVLLALAVFVALWLVRQSIQPPAVRDHLRNDAGLALAALQDGGDVKNVIIRCYLQMQRELANAQGLELEASLTPREFQEQMVALGLPAGPTGQLTRLFEEVRYGHKPTGLREEQLAIRCLGELAQDRHRES